MIPELRDYQIELTQRVRAQVALGKRVIVVQATTGEVHDLRRETRALKECVADLTLENRLLKKSMIADGGDDE